MADVWSRERVLALAPDASSASAGSGLGTASKWSLLGRSDAALWGEIKGSGSKPYQTRVDLSEPAFKCSCPSRKFPCKHGLGLMLVYAARPDALPVGAPPGWVSEWLTERESRAEKKAAKVEAAAAAPRDEAAAARRVEQREQKIADGLEELTRWMEDLVRQGFGAVQTLPAKTWENMAARLIDGQAPGLARRVRDLSAVAFSGEGWQQRLLLGLGRLTLLVDAYRRLEHLPIELQADVRGEVGWTRSTEEVLALPGVVDQWAVVGRRVTQEDQLRVQRTWLLGAQAGRAALVLHFAAGAQPLDVSLQVGTSVQAELAFYPGAAQQRALVKGTVASRAALHAIPAHEHIAAALDGFSDALARQPWIDIWPLAVRDVAIEPRIADGDLAGCLIRDAQQRRVPLAVDADVGWQLVAIAGGNPLTLFGEWDGEILLPLSVAAAGRFYALIANDAGRSLVRVA